MSSLGLSPLKGKFCVAWTAELSLMYNSRATSEEFAFQNTQCRLQFDFIRHKCKLVLTPAKGLTVTEPFVVTVFVTRGNDDDPACRTLACERVSELPWECPFKEDHRHQYSYQIKNIGWRLRLRFVVIFEDDSTHEVRNESLERPRGAEVVSNDPDFPPNLDSLSLDFANLLKNETLPDVKLKCGVRGRAIPAHRAVLAARSEVFAAMFRSEMAESRSGDVDMPDVEDDVIDPFLQYVYSGKVPSGVSDEVVPGLYAAADKYAVHALRETCRDRMVSCLTQENCVTFLTVADAHGDAEFKKLVMEYICSHDAVLKGEDWRKFAKKPSSLAIEVYDNFVESKTSGIRLDDILAHCPVDQPNRQASSTDQTNRQASSTDQTNRILLDPFVVL